MPLRREYVPDRRVGFTFEQLAVDSLHVLGAGAARDLKPVPGPFDIGSPGLGDALVQLIRAPVIRALAQAIRGEEEDRLRAGQLGSAAQVLAVGDADRRGVPELVAVVAVDGTPHLGV